MRLLWIAEYYPFPPHDGYALPIHEFIRRLAPRAAVTLLTHTPGGNSQLSAAERLAEGTQACAAWGVELVHVARTQRGRVAQTLACLRAGTLPNRIFSPPLAERAATLLAERRHELVICEGTLTAPHLPPPGPGIPPRVIMARDCLSLAHQRAWRLHHAPSQWLQACKIAAIERAQFSRAARVYAISPIDEDAMRTVCPAGRFGVLPNGVDLGRFCPRPEAIEPETVLFSGHFRTPANHDAACWLLAAIWPQVLRARPRARLILAGADPQPALHAAAAALPDGGASVEITGTVPDMAAQLQRATIIASPLRLGTGIKNKLLEGAAVGAPLVVTPLSLEGLAFVPGRDIIAAASADAFASALIALLGDAPRRAELGAAALHCVRTHYNWDALAERLWTELQPLAQGGRA